MVSAEGVPAVVVESWAEVEWVADSTGAEAVVEVEVEETAWEPRGAVEMVANEVWAERVVVNEAVAMMVGARVAVETAVVRVGLPGTEAGVMEMRAVVVKEVGLEEEGKEIKEKKE